MPIFSADDIAKFRGLYTEMAMPDSFEIERYTVAANGEGGHIQTWSTVGSGDCRLRSAGSGDEKVIADRLSWTAPYAVDLPMETDVTPRDRLVVNGRTMEIGAVIDGGSYAIKKTVICKAQG